MRWALGVILGLALGILSFEATHTGIAGRYVDPVSHIEAQDEAVYAHSAIQMAERGHWLTPMLLGRYGLYKPPLLIWLSGLAARGLGVSAFALRLPAVLAGSLMVGLVFVWLLGLRPSWAAAAGALLLLSNSLWQALSSLCLTDALLAAFVTAALLCLRKDPELRRPGALCGFAVSTAAAILTKSVAGLLPLIVLYALRPPARRALQASALTAAIALPWFLYQVLVHPHWFWYEQVAGEILAFGMGNPPQTSAENQVLFYARRLFLTDPVLCLGAAVALPSLLRAVRRRCPAATVLLLWIGTVFACAIVWRYRNLAYILPAVPALAILAAGYGPLSSGRRPAYALAALGLLFCAKTRHPGEPWGIALHPPPIIASEAALSDYCGRGRAAELILVEPDDQFYSADLPLPRIRYCFVDPRGGPPPEPLDFRYLGIMLTTGQFDDAARWQAVFRQRLRQWNLDSDAPIGNVIIAASRAEVGQIIRAHPGSDFLLPLDYRTETEPLAAATHSVALAPGGKFFLLARHPARVDGWRRPVAAGCRL